MRTTVNLDDELVEKAKRYSNIEDTPSLMREALHALIQREASRKLIQAGGSIPGINPIARNRPS